MYVLVVKALFLVIIVGFFIELGKKFFLDKLQKHISAVDLEIDISRKKRKMLFLFEKTVQLPNSLGSETLEVGNRTNFLIILTNIIYLLFYFLFFTITIMSIS